MDPDPLYAMWAHPLWWGGSLLGVEWVMLIFSLWHVSSMKCGPSNPCEFIFPIKNKHNLHPMECLTWIMEALGGWLAHRGSRSVPPMVVPPTHILHFTMFFRKIHIHVEVIWQNMLMICLSFFYSDVLLMVFWVYEKCDIFTVNNRHRSTIMALVYVLE